MLMLLSTKEKEMVNVIFVSSTNEDYLNSRRKNVTYVSMKGIFFLKNEISDTMI